jgi:hypothetical protein
MLRGVVWYIVTEVSEVLTAIVLVMEAVSTSKTSASIYKLHGTTSQKIAIFIPFAVRT